jgi:hypothetical protein
LLCDRLTVDSVRKSYDFDLVLVLPPPLPHIPHDEDAGAGRSRRVSTRTVPKVVSIR